MREKESEREHEREKETERERQRERETERERDRERERQRERERDRDRERNKQKEIKSICIFQLNLNHVNFMGFVAEHSTWLLGIYKSHLFSKPLIFERFNIFYKQSYFYIMKNISKLFSK